MNAKVETKSIRELMRTELSEINREILEFVLESDSSDTTQGRLDMFRVFVRNACVELESVNLPRDKIWAFFDLIDMGAKYMGISTIHPSTSVRELQFFESLINRLEVFGNYRGRTEND